MRNILITLCLFVAVTSVAQDNSIFDQNFHLVIDDDLYEAQSNKVNKALVAFWPEGTHKWTDHYITNIVPLWTNWDGQVFTNYHDVERREPTTTEKGMDCGQGWEYRYCKVANTNEIYLIYSMTQKQIRDAASSGALATLKDKIEAAGIPDTKFMIFRNTVLQEVDDYAFSRGLKYNPPAFAE